MKFHQYVNGPILGCQGVTQTIQVLETVLAQSEVFLDSSSGSTSKKLINALTPKLRMESWRNLWPIDRTVSSNAYASFFIDYYKDENSLNCGHLHRYFLQFMFDNRQAIGTNLIKFEIASRNSLLGNRIPTCIAICAEELSVKKLGWDGGVASSQEYLDAINGPYLSILTNPPMIFSIENLTNSK